MIKVEVQYKPNPNVIIKLLPLKITMDILIVIS